MELIQLADWLTICMGPFVLAWSNFISYIPAQVGIAFQFRIR